MGRKHTAIFLIILALVVALIVVLVANSGNMAILSPAGTVARQEHALLIFTVLLMLVIIIPVFVMTFVISLKYREGNPKKTKYSPNWDGSRLYESIWWGFPLLIIATLSVVTWVSTHQLDPFRPLDSKTEPMKIQVVALQWRWLFIYPDQRIATINDVRFPQKTPIDFEITADAPMNSFWIPKLGGQMYAMTGMATHLHLEASQPGTYRGSSANISGEGFAGMKFTATSLSAADFKKWVKKTKQSPQALTAAEYTKLALPSKDGRPMTYFLKDDSLYDTIVMKYMEPLPEATEDDHSMPGMDMKHMDGMDH